MKLRLKQYDIINNQYNDEMNEEYLNKRIERRLRQIDNIKRLLSEELTYKDYFDLVLDTYEIDFNYNQSIYTKYIDSSDSIIIVNLKTDDKIEDNYLSMCDMVQFLMNNFAMIDSISVDDLEYDYMSKYYDLDSVDFSKYDDFKDFSVMLGMVKDVLRKDSIFNVDLIANIKLMLNEKRLTNDLDDLEKLTNNELKSIEFKKIRKLT